MAVADTAYGKDQQQTPGVGSLVVSSDGESIPAVSPRAAWERHAAVATATSPVTDGLGPERERQRPLRPLPRVMVGSTAAMVVVTVALTVIAGPLYGVAERAADDLVDRSPYISAVFGEREVP